MAKLVLEFEADYDFHLIGICSHVKDYRISWEINKLLGLGLVRDEDYKLFLQKEVLPFPFFSYIKEEELKEFYLIGNRSKGVNLIPEEAEVDYFLMLKGFFSETEVKHLAQKIGGLKTVLTSFAIEVEALKSKQNLVF